MKSEPDGGHFGAKTPGAAISTPRRSRWRQKLRPLLIRWSCIYIGVCVLVWALQSYIVFPGAHFLGEADRKLVEWPGTEVLKLSTKDAAPIAAWFGDALDAAGRPLPDPSTRPAIIYFYGNGSSANLSDDVLENLRLMGLNVIIPDYPGFGSSGGSPSEAGCYASADAAYDELLRRGFTQPGQIYALGWSLGGAVAIDLASRRPIGKLAVYSSFTSLHDMGRHMLPWLPTSLFLSWKFDSMAKLPTIPCPMFFVHGQSDSTIPPFMQDQLAAAATGAASVTVVKVPGAEHNDIFIYGPDSGQDVWRKLGRFMKGE